jgi:hypothetical protein
VVSDKGKWCEITSEAMKRKGFIVCRLLGNRPLKLEDVGNSDSSEYNPLRAFWVAPSVYRLKLAGEHYEKTMLSERQKRSENLGDIVDHNAKFINPVRPKISEFEEMKKLLEKGVVAHREMRRKLPSVNSEHSFVLERMSKARRSLFKNQDELAPLSFTIEALSAQFGITERMRVLSGAKWYRSEYENRVAGAWDVGDLEIMLEKPVITYVVGRTGLASAAAQKGPERQNADSEYGCQESSDFGLRGGRRLRGYPEVKDPLISFYTKEPLPYKKVDIKLREFEAQHRIGESESRPKPHFRYEIDLDRDGRADLTVWEVKMRWTSSSEKNIVERHLFGNIDGEWRLFKSDYYYDGCT